MFPISGLLMACSQHGAYISYAASYLIVALFNLNELKCVVLIDISYKTMNFINAPRHFNGATTCFVLPCCVFVFCLVLVFFLHFMHLHHPMHTRSIFDSSRKIASRSCGKIISKFNFPIYILQKIGSNIYVSFSKY